MQRYTRPLSGLGRGLGHLPPQGKAPSPKPSPAGLRPQARVGAQPL